MPISTLGDRVGHSTATTGQGIITLGAALGAVPIGVASFQSAASAGVTDGKVISYTIIDAPNWEVGTGTYTAAGTTLTRTVLFSSNSNTAISLSGNAQVFIQALNEDIGPGVILHVDQDQSSFLTAIKRGWGSANLQMIVQPQGRLTLATATPVMTTGVPGATTIYYTPYIGATIPIYDGTNFQHWKFAEMSVATTDTTQNPSAIGASKVNDWFVWAKAGVLVLSHGPDWTNDTTRVAGTALTRVNGIWLNNAQIGDGSTTGPSASRGTYVGTTRSDGSSQLNWVFGAVASGGTAGLFGVWNSYNRVNVSTFVGDSTASWTYGVQSVWRAPNGNATMRVSAVRGLDEDSIEATYKANGHPGAATNAIAGVGLDSTTAFSGTTQLSNAQVNISLEGRYSGLTGIGFHFVSALEFNDTATSSTWYGAVETGGQTGLHVTLRQ